jgi:hypothetical protein
VKRGRVSMWSAPLTAPHMLVEAIESKTFAGEVIVGATSILMGAEALAEQRADHERIAGQLRAVTLVVALAEQQADSVAMMVTTIAMPGATVH